MFSSLISLLITLVVIYVIYVVLEWILGKFPVPSVTGTVLNVIFGAAAIIAVLKFAAVFLHLA